MDAVLNGLPTDPQRSLNFSATALLKRHKTQGSKDLRPRPLKIARYDVMEELTHVFSGVREDHKAPMDWMEVNLSPSLRKADKMSVLIMRESV